MDDKEYEATTAALYQALGEGSGLTIEGFGASCRVQGKSGTWYQVDVLARQSNGLQTIRTAIECKYWKKRVTRNVVSNLITLLEDTDIEKGVVVSRKGFTSGAISLAKQRNISLVEMREPDEYDWEGNFKTVHVLLHMISTEYYDFELVQPPQDSRERVQLTASGQDLLIKEPTREAITLEQVVNGASPSTSQDQEIEVRFPAGTTIQLTGFDKQAAIEAVRFKVRNHIHKEEITIDGDQAIRLIVREVFEERQLHIGHDGQIAETTDWPGVTVHRNK